MRITFFFSIFNTDANYQQKCGHITYIIYFANTAQGFYTQNIWVIRIVCITDFNKLQLFLYVFVHRINVSFI
jgi:hypothetical protein